MMFRVHRSVLCSPLLRSSSNHGFTKCRAKDTHTTTARSILPLATTPTFSYSPTSSHRNPVTTAPFTTASSGGAGAGIGNVQDKMLPSSNQTEWHQMFHHIQRPKTVSIIGAPMTFGQPYVGTDHGPRMLREAGLLQHLASLGWRIHDNPDLDFKQLFHDEKELFRDLPNAKNSMIVGKGCKMLADLVTQEIHHGRFPMILGGDHSIAIGSLAGILRARPNTGVLWVDAHSDINTPDTTESGNIHGMPVGLLMNGLLKNHSSLPGLDWLDQPDYSSCRLNPDSIVYIGLRDVDRGERRILREHNIKAFTMYDIDLMGIGKVMDLAFEHLLRNDPKRPIHLSYDIDAVDPADAPATGTAVRGGLTYREAHFVAEYTAKSGCLSSIDMVELNPTLSNGSGATATIELGLGLLTSLMGKSII